MGSYLEPMFEPWHIHGETSCGEGSSVGGRVVNFPAILYLVIQLHDVNIMMQGDNDHQLRRGVINTNKTLAIQHLARKTSKNSF